MRFETLRPECDHGSKSLFYIHRAIGSAYVSILGRKQRLNLRHRGFTVEIGISQNSQRIPIVERRQDDHLQGLLLFYIQTGQRGHPCAKHREGIRPTDCPIEDSDLYPWFKAAQPPLYVLLKICIHLPFPFFSSPVAGITSGCLAAG